MARKAQAAMEGRPLSQDTLSAALAAVAEDVVITPQAPGEGLHPAGPAWLQTPCGHRLSWHAVRFIGKVPSATHSHIAEAGSVPQAA